MIEPEDVPEALQDHPDPVVFLDRLGLVEPLRIASVGRPVRLVRVVVRPHDDARPSSWSVSALARVPWSRAHSPGLVDIRADSVSLRWGGRAPHMITNEVSLPDPTELNLLIVDLFDRRQRVIGHSAVEVRTLPDEQTYRALRAYAAVSQSAADPGPLISLVRFAGPLEAVAHMVPGARVFVSGCGTGGEMAVLARMGAAQVVGSELPGQVLDLARRLTRDDPRITVVPAEVAQQMRDCFDLAISRHVIEHVGNSSDQRRYLAHLIDIVHVGCQVVVEFPNQDCPIEPHTGLEFFHWLDDDRRKQAVEYLALRSSAGCFPAARVELLRALGEHRNVSLQDLKGWVPANAELVGVRTYDDAFQTDHRLASTISCHIRRVS